MNLPTYSTAHDKPSRNDLARQMNTVLNFLYNGVAPKSVMNAAKEVCEELALEKEIMLEGEE